MLVGATFPVLVVLGPVLAVCGGRMRIARAEVKRHAKEKPLALTLSLKPTYVLCYRCFCMLHIETLKLLMDPFYILPACDTP